MVNEQMYAQLPRLWFIDGGQRWAWAHGGAEKSGYIEFARDGKLLTSWGDGTWKAQGEEMEVSFGSPAQTRRLRRTRQGFRCVPALAYGYEDQAIANSGSPTGWPLYGVAESIALAPLRQTPWLAFWELVLMPRGWKGSAMVFFTVLAAAVATRLQHRDLSRNWLKAGPRS